MNLDEEAINAVKEYFESITQSAIDIVYESVDSDTTFSEFMEGVNQKVNQFASELVASEVLNLSAKSIENFNSGAGMEVDDVQELIENDGELDSDEDDEDEGIRF
jgi:hypothetical protein